MVSIAHGACFHWPRVIKSGYIICPYILKGNVMEIKMYLFWDCITCFPETRSEPFKHVECSNKFNDATQKI